MRFARYAGIPAMLTLLALAACSGSGISTNPPITHDSQAGTPGKRASLTGPLNADIMALSPLAYYRLDEASGTTVADSSGHGYNLTTTTPTTVTLGVAGLAGDGGTAYNFTAATSSIHGTVGASIAAHTTMTIVAFLKGTFSTAGAHVVACITKSECMIVDGGHMGYYWLPNAAIVRVPPQMTTTVTDGTTHMFVLEMLGSGSCVGSVDGGPLTTFSSTCGLGGTIAADWSIGTDYYSGHNLPGFLGTYDNIAAFYGSGAALTQTQVCQLASDAGLAVGSCPTPTPSPTPTPAPGPTPNGSLYVANNGDGSLTTYAAGSYSAPATTITTLDGLSTSNEIRVDGFGNIWAANQTAIYEFAPNANGLATPTRTITLASPPVGFPGFGTLSIDNSGTIYATQADGTTIFAFASTASGSSTPVRTIAGASTTLVGANLMASDASGDLWVGDATGESLVEFAPTANGNVAPISTLYDSSEASTCSLQTGAPDGLVIDASGNIVLKLNFAATPSIANLVEYGPGAQATGDCPGERGNLQYGEGDIGIDSSGFLYVPDPANKVYVYSLSSVYAAFPSSYSPAFETISGSGSGLNDPYSLSVAP